MAKGKRSDKLSGVLAAILCLPLAVIAYLLIMHYTQSISLDNVTAVSIRTPDESEAEFSAENDVDFFVNVLNSSLSINSTIRDVSGEEPVYIICSDGDETLEYRLYPSLDLSGCLLVGPEGELYVLETDSAKELLLRAEFDYLYSDLFLPTLTVVSGDKEYVVDPIESDWTYHKADGEKYTYTPEKHATGDETYTILKGLENSLKFSPNAESLPYEMTDISYISQNGSQYNIKDISELNLSVDTMLSVSFTAKWSSYNGAQAYGEAKYSFKLRYDIPAAVEIPVTEYTVGDIIKISATHLNEDEVIDLVTALKVNGIHFDVIDNDKGITLIPIGIGNAAGKYSLEIKTGVGSTDATIDLSAISDREFVSITEISNEQYGEMLSLDKMTEFKDTLASLTASRPDINHFIWGEGSIGKPVSKDAKYSFGQPIQIKTYKSDDTGSRICEGDIYELDDGTQVRSVQAGEVVFSGTLAPTGNTVIIYHGYGIYSYYYHLATLDVSQGEIVNNGQVVGFAGSTGFTNGKTALHYALSIDGIFVNPDSI